MQRIFWFYVGHERQRWPAWLSSPIPSPAVWSEQIHTLHFSSTLPRWKWHTGWHFYHFPQQQNDTAGTILSLSSPLILWGLLAVTSFPILLPWPQPLNNIAFSLPPNTELSNRFKSEMNAVNTSPYSRQTFNNPPGKEELLKLLKCILWGCQPGVKDS